MEERRSGLSRFAKILIALAILLVIVFFLMVSAVAGLVGRASEDEDTRKPHLVLLRLEGPIFESEPLLNILARIEKDPQCKGILLRVESPGGSVGSSQEIYGALKRLREKGLPVVASFGNVAASGGYYVALATDRIFSNPGTLTGSIGVIFQFPEAEKLLDKVGISVRTVKSGALKDVGNPARAATPEELAFLQGVIDDTYAQFLEDAAASRKLPIDSLRRIADGRVLTGRQALKAGLVDTLGGLDDAKRYLEARVQSPGIAWTVEPKPRSRLSAFLEPEAKSSLDELLSGMRQQLKPGALFLWP